MDEKFGNWVAWLQKSKTQLAGAKFIYANFERLIVQEKGDGKVEILAGCFDAVLLLLGYSVENALKGVIVAEKGVIRTRTGRKVDIKKMFRSLNHDLVVYAEVASFKLTTKQAAMAKRLSNAINWTAKYPAATEYAWYQQNDIKKMRQLISSDFDLVGDIVAECDVLAYDNASVPE